MFGRPPLAAFTAFIALLACAPAAAAFDEPLDPPLLTGPTVAITEPAGGATIPYGEATTIRAETSDDVTSVEFFVNGQSIGEDTDPGDGFTAADSPTALDAGTSRDISVVASDGLGNTAPAAITVQVEDRPPTVTLDEPDPGATLPYGQATTLRATATDDVDVASVEFFAGGQSLGQDTTPGDGYSATYEPTAADAGASRELSAVATDSAGNTTRAAITVQVEDRPPAVTLDAPAEGATLRHSQPTTIRATATDDLSVAEVEFFADGQSIGKDTTGEGGEYTIAWTPARADAGQAKQIKAVATDSAAQTDDDSASVLIADDEPAVAFESPTDGATIPHNATTRITVTATDDRSIQRVEFRRGPSSLGNGTPAAGSRYTVDYRPAASHAGSGQALVATAVDDAGQRKTVAIGVRVSSPPAAQAEPLPEDRPPSVTFTSPGPGAAIDPRFVPRLGANAADDRGVARVTFLDDGRVVCVDDAAPFDCGYAPSGDDVGRNTLIAVAQDGAGQTAVDFRAITVGKFNPGLTARTTPRRDRRRPYRYRTSGKLTLPAGVTPAQACGRGGSVQVQFAAGKLRLPISAPLKADCSFRTSIAFPTRRPLGRRGRLKVTTYFAGNEVLGAARGPKQRVRAG